MYLVALGGLTFAQTPLPIARILVEGNSRFDAGGIIAASGLQTGQAMTVPVLEAAGKKLLDSGMFQTVSYRYAAAKDPGAKGYDVTLQVAEISYLQPVKLDIPGVDENILWAWLAKQNPLLLKQAPSSDRASQQYTSAVARYLSEQGRPEEIVSKVVEDPETKAVTILIRPKILPIVKEIKFEGNQAASADALLKPMARYGLNAEYTEQGFRRLLEAYARPVYEELGCLAATFPKVETAPSPSGEGITVTVTVDEGAVYHLAKVNLDAGDFETSDLMRAAKFPTGKIANAKLIAEAVANIEKVFQGNGYIHVASRVERHLDAASKNLSLDVHVDSGKQFYFGQLFLQGLQASAEPQVRVLWKLERGQPMDLLYLEDFKQKVFDEGAAGSRKMVQHELKPRPGTDLMDVILTFR